MNNRFVVNSEGNYELDLGELMPNIPMKIISKEKEIEPGYIFTLYIGGVESISRSGNGFDLVLGFILNDINDTLRKLQSDVSEFFETVHTALIQKR